LALQILKGTGRNEFECEDEEIWRADPLQGTKRPHDSQGSIQDSREIVMFVVVTDYVRGRLIEVRI
jgi:hypothetical protein